MHQDYALVSFLERVYQVYRTVPAIRVHDYDRFVTNGQRGNERGFKRII
jgi:hypothetical protein